MTCLLKLKNGARNTLDRFCKLELQGIFDYYHQNASLSVARKLVSGIVIESKKISKNPEGGQKEGILLQFGFDYRYTVYKNYKIVYLIDRNRGRIEIHDVLDIPQHPHKLTRKK